MVTSETGGTNGGPDLRREDAPQEFPEFKLHPNETRAEFVDRAILEGMADRRHVLNKLADQAIEVSHLRTEVRTLSANVSLAIGTIQSAALSSAAAPPAPHVRPPLPSLHEVDLEVIDRTSNGTPIYKTSQPELQAVRETDRRAAYVDFAAGEAERFQVAIDKDRKQQALIRDAAPKRYIVGDLGPKALMLLVGAIIAAAVTKFFSHK